MIARLTCPMIGAKTTNEFTVNKNDDGVGDWRPALGSVFIQGYAASCCALAIRSRGPARALAHPFTI